MLDIQNLTDYPVDEDSFSQVAKNVLAGENREKEHVSLVFVSKEEMQKLNKQFRGKDTPTDVLSFNLDEPEHLGEVVICPDALEGQNVMKVFIHGILHLLGYDHEISPAEEKRMFDRQDTYLAQIHLT